MPTSTRPWRVCSSPRSSSNRASTIVLATEITTPTTSPCSGGQPRSAPTATASAILTTVPVGPPTSATHFTRSRSLSENSRPTANISSTTPISAKTSKWWPVSEIDGPGVNWLMRIPPST